MATYGLRIGFSGLPEWISSAATGEWVEVPTSQPSTASGLVPAVSGSMGSQSGIINAYNGAFVYGGKYYIHGGGHGDYGGNEVGVIDLMSASPAWDLLIERTPVADLLGSSNYYADGLPTSRHTYYGMWVIQHSGVPKMIRLNWWMGFAFNGSPVGGANGTRTTLVDAFNLSTNQWETELFDLGSVYASASETPMAQDHTTGDVFVMTNSTKQVYRVNASTLATTELANLSGTEGTGGACVFDADNRRLVRFAGRSSGTVIYWNEATNLQVTPTLTGPDAADLSGLSGDHHGWGVAHDTVRNVAWLRCAELNDSATDVPEGRMWRIRLDDWYVERVTVGGAAPAASINGIYGRLKYVPELDAVAYLPIWASPVYVMRCY